ncbi:MAG: hypothetical protein ACHQQS_15140 [Thermoanaerobaculales bacterium]
MNTILLGVERGMEPGNVLTVEVKNSRPVLLTDFTKSFFGMADEFDRFLARQPVDEITKEARLYVREVRAGSIIWDLIVYSAQALPVVAYTVDVLDFGRYLSTAYHYLLGKDKAKPELRRKDYENLVDIVEPIAKDSASQFNLNVVINGNLELQLPMNSAEANAAQNVAKREISAMTEQTTGLRQNVAMYFYQARNDPKSTAGDRIIIESVWPHPVRAVFRDENTKAGLMARSDNPFRHAYVADVGIETVGGRPVLYQVLAVHDIIELPSLPEGEPPLLLS